MLQILACCLVSLYKEETELFLSSGQREFKAISIPFHYTVVQARTLVSCVNDISNIVQATKTTEHVILSFIGCIHGSRKEFFPLLLLEVLHGWGGVGLPLKQWVLAAGELGILIGVYRC